MRLLNLTPHELVLVGENSDPIVRIPQSGQVARVATRATKVGEVEVDGYIVPVVSTEFGEIDGLPEATDGTIYIVSIVALAALKGTRQDVVAPDTGPQSAIRNADGTIKGVKRFTR
ncbi:MAG TPA: hypothetical protein DIS53_03650 [Candidatus Wildermuthbacteria bacterium]|uniref:Uncharacterized protein n=1 Tax=Candidatus Yanofskybacteria bacterium GW2011_GWC1_48_11 TaxID=1619027 RepID=A0A837INY7_9BACT|nr:MAG: hypothetical protein UY25_C0002G0029 [Candidatus Yanofskybacteria bacterium GW2011_GWC1_48_11]KKW04723.1 MAG: hypothetical protein UY38_C0001G0290 [Parcubacteria group bacterium GW2011_GWB1_49_12]KKW08977.1 MAG: hypothetical protein UY45_C0002G0029 [Parcubacteria group bacterium GW2011_GWA1_49_26]KKW14253.1 MAG: hypothetical protein UY53_C0002G0042 [Parcubacteria group bacterium GW2011_GWA2_50_10]OHA61033.1 MAG: hypothetical protein A2109_02145 [Candidatus Wildermuthbacteria bacterium G